MHICDAPARELRAEVRVQRVGVLISCIVAGTVGAKTDSNSLRADLLHPNCCFRIDGTIQTLLGLILRDYIEKIQHQYNNNKTSFCDGIYAPESV